MREGDTLGGLRVFLVEDESLVAMQLEDMVEDLGGECVGLAMKLSRALDMLEGIAAIDVAILDVNLGGDKVYPVAERLRQRAVPIVFATGYGRAGVDPEWQSCEVVQKPYTMQEIAAAVTIARQGVPSA
ncbi:response regulator [Aureimonas glaciei]|jgi:CheY-like chemotaxis protein|uniref:Response regulator n=1 Tax=Aureimonas glaciei TaxID=1776957 RepID=A0A916XZ17_9HYPH|nr:response regulator [Aureimonas glaciei]GGD20953.1 response regulator [Aureimonas glaciei]